MSLWLPFESESFNSSLKSMTNGFSDNVYKHSGSVMSGGYHVSDWKEALLTNSKLAYMPLRRHSRLKKVSHKRFINFFEISLSTSDLHLIKRIVSNWFFNLNDLRSIELNDGSRDNMSPSIP
jgi:hypothetical protein